MKSSQPLTRRQREIVEYISDFIKAHAYAPSLQEIADALSLRSLATVHKHLENLRQKGHIRRAWNRARHIDLVVGVGCCPTCGRELEKSVDEAKVSIEIGRKVCEDKAVEKGAVTPIPT